VITFDGTTTDAIGQGFGNVETLLVLQNNPSEFGSVTWDGSSVQIADDAKVASNAPSVADIKARFGGAPAREDLRILFNINQAGSQSLDLHDFAVTFLDSTGSSLGFQADFTEGGANSSTSGLAEVGGGTGGSGHVFDLNLSETEYNTFFGSDSNRLGMFVLSSEAIDNAAVDGPESFALTAIPEPGSMTLIAVGLVGFVGYTWRRRRPRS
jgi:hypothetical protein